MTKTFSVNENNDIFIGNDGNLSISAGLQAVLFVCANAAKAQLGEMVLQVEQGIPNFQTIWSGSPNVAQFEAALRTTLLNVADVTEVSNLSIAISNNVLSYTTTINTIYGNGIING